MAVLCDAARIPGVEEAFYFPGFVSVEEAERLQAAVASAPKPKWQHLRNRRLQNWGGLPAPKGMVAQTLPPWLRALTTRIDALGLYPEGNEANHVLINEYGPGQGIMPHEDGPLYFPTIATVTLGSHAVLNFYDKTDSSSDPAGKQEKAPAATETGTEAVQNEGQVSGDALASAQQPVNAWGAPRYSLLLEPNSLVVMRDSLYQMLHGIDEVVSDVVDPAALRNLPLCGGGPYTAGQVLPRGTRLSFTIRNVPRVVKLRGLGFLAGGRR